MGDYLGVFVVSGVTILAVWLFYYYGEVKNRKK